MFDGDDIEYLGTKRAGTTRLSITSSSKVFTAVALHVQSPDSERNRRLVFPKDTTRTICIGRSPPGHTPSETSGMFRCPVVSRKHAKITFSDSEAFVTDTNSHHGTHIRRPNSLSSTMLFPDVATQLRQGDFITFGKTVGKDDEYVRPVVVRVELLHENKPRSQLGTPIIQRSVEINDTSPKSSSGRYGVYSPSSQSSSSSLQSSDEMDISSNSDNDSDIEELPVPLPIASAVLPRAPVVPLPIAPVPMRSASSIVEKATGALKKLIEPRSSSSSPAVAAERPALQLSSSPMFNFGSSLNSAKFTFNVPSLFNSSPPLPSLSMADPDWRNRSADSIASPIGSFENTPWRSTSASESLTSRLNFFPFRPRYTSNSPPVLPPVASTSSSPSQGQTDVTFDGSPTDTSQTSSASSAFQVPEAQPRDILPSPIFVGAWPGENGSSDSFPVPSLPPLDPVVEDESSATKAVEDTWTGVADEEMGEEGADDDDVDGEYDAVDEEQEDDEKSDEDEDEEEDEMEDVDEDNVNASPSPLPASDTRLDKLESEIEGLKDNFKQLDRLRRQSRARFNANVSVATNNMNKMRGSMDDLKAKFKEHSDALNDVRHAMEGIESKQAGFQGLVNDVRMDVDIESDRLLKRVEERERQVQLLDAKVNSLEVTGNARAVEYDDDKAENESMVGQLKMMIDEVRKLRQDTDKELDVEKRALALARSSAEGELRQVVELRRRMQVVEQEMNAAKTRTLSPLKRKRDVDDSGDSVGGAGAGVSESESDRGQWKPLEILGGTSVDGDDDGVGHLSTSAVVVASAGSSLPPPPPRKRAKKMVRAVARTAATVTVGAVAAWTALAFS